MISRSIDIQHSLRNGWRTKLCSRVHWLAAFAFSFAACTPNDRCANGQVVECACAPGIRGLQRCVVGTFDVCDCAADGGPGDGGISDDAFDTSADAGDGLLAPGDPCSPPAPMQINPTPARCTDQGALFCNPTTSVMEIESCEGGFCVEDELIQIACPGCTPVRPEVRFQWADCVAEVEPACVQEPSGGRWWSDVMFECRDPHTATSCGSLGGGQLLAGSPRGYLYLLHCGEGLECMENRCLLPIECEVDETFCDGEYLISCQITNGAVRRPVRDGYTCQRSEACHEEIDFRFANVVPETEGARCIQGTPRSCTGDLSGIMLCGHVNDGVSNCHGEATCMCDQTVEPCDDGTRCFQATAEWASCVPDVDCSAGDHCAMGDAIDCGGAAPSRHRCTIHGNECSVVTERAVCSAPGACEEAPVCVGTHIEQCCDATGVFHSSTGHDLPCVPGERVRFLCEAPFACLGGECIL